MKAVKQQIVRSFTPHKLVDLVVLIHGPGVVNVQYIVYGKQAILGPGIA